MSRTRGRAMRYWFESSAGPFHFERLITVKLALAGLLTATVSYLAVNSSANGNSAARNTERYAILTASQNVQGQARYNYDYYGAFRLWQDLNYQGLQAAAQGDTEKADRLKQARDAIQDQSALLRPEYAGSIEPVTIIPGFYLGSPQLVAYGADLYVGPAAQTQERYSIASRQRDKWSAQGTEYVRTLAFLGVSLLLLGLAMPLPRTFRMLFYGLGVAVALGAGYNAAGVYLSKVPEVSEAAIQAYGDGVLNAEKATDQPDRLPIAINDFGRAIAAQKDYGHAYFARAEALVDRADGAKAKDAPAAKKDYDAALADYEAAVKYAEDEITLAQQAYASRGRVLYSLGRIDEAVKMDRKALELNPSQNSVRYNLMLALLASGDIEGAQRQFDEGVAAAHESIIEAQAKGGFASPIVFFNLDRAAVGLRSLSTRIAKGDKAGGSAPPVNSIPADKQGAILDKADELFGLARSNAIGLERPTAEVVTNKPAGKVLDVSAGLRRADSTIVDKRRSFVPLSKEVTLLVNYSGFQPGQRLTLRVDPRTIGTEKGAEKLTRLPKNSEPFSALAFKIAMDEGRKVVFFRVFSGMIEAGAEVLNVRTNKREKIARLFQIHAAKRERLEKAVAGEIVAAAGLKDATTGDTICDPKAPILLERIDTYEPVISQAIEADNAAAKERLDFALGKMSEEDPTFRTREDPDTGQTLISGMGELHLEIIVDRMKREYGVQARAGKPQVVYRETVLREGEGTSVFERSGGDGKIGDIYGEATCRVKARPRGAGMDFKKALPGGISVPPLNDVAINAAMQGLRDAASSGPDGYPLEDVEVTLTKLVLKEGSNGEIGARAAAAEAFRRAVAAATPSRLEPIMAVEVTVDEEFLGSVIGDLNQRRGQVQDVGSRGVKRLVAAHVPLRNMFGYSTRLRSLTEGRATFSMLFHAYDTFSS